VKNPMVTFLVLEDGEAVIAVLRQYGIQKLAEISTNISGKQYKLKDHGEKTFFEDVLDTLKASYTDGPLLIIGPGFTKEDFAKFAREKAPEILKNSTLQGTGQAGMTGVNEVMKKGIAGNVLENNRVNQETQIIEAFFGEIAQNGKATYGLAEITKALKTGAVEKLLISDSKFRTDDGRNLLQTAAEMHTETMITSTVHDAGKRLDAIGGYGAILRYQTY